MSYDCIIATRNRLNALRMSIPLILKQDVLPGRLIIIDASHDHDAVRTEVHDISERLGFKDTIVAKSDASNSARQRNIGLQFVQAPVVMFPDDDSMWHTGFASCILKIYQADMRGQVGGVSGVGVLTPPPELGQPTYNRSRFRTAKQALQPYRNYIEQRFFPKPFDAIGASTWTDKVDVVDNINSKRLPLITGCRMSFRTDAMRRVGFDETLGYGSGYSYHEDFDVSLRLEREGYALVSAENAKVCHLSFPGKRGDGYGYGFCAIANCVYVCKKTMNGDTQIFRIMERYLKYKLSLYAGRFYTNHDRQVFRGAFDAWRNRFQLLNADGAGLSDAYKSLCDRYLDPARQGENRIN
jgi:cellulose synthase/poly-beta-1,6-N-acetylglucosamine synthase-like glycosyltransferase